MPKRSPCVLVFDLDDTLYLERDFVMSGFRATDKWLRQECGVSGLESVCTRLFAEGNRASIFDEALRELIPQHPHPLVDTLVEIYRSHAPDISLAIDARHCLDRYAGNRPLGLVTDGRADTQRAKIRSLNLECYLDCIVCTDDWGRECWKPHPRAFEFMEKRFSASGKDMMYIADNPVKDFVTPNARGWRTVQLARPERIHKLTTAEPSHSADQVIETLDELDLYAGVM